MICYVTIFRRGFYKRQKLCMRRILIFQCCNQLEPITLKADVVVLLNEVLIPKLFCGYTHIIGS